MTFGRWKVGASAESLVDIFGNLLFVPAVGSRPEAPVSSVSLYVLLS
jgi:hypothetical protein